MESEAARNDPLQTFFDSYLSAILTNGEDENQDSLFVNYDVNNISEASRARAFIECRDFYSAYPDLIGGWPALGGDLFWVARNKMFDNDPVEVWNDAFGPAEATTLTLAATACGTRVVTVEGGELIIN